MPRALAAALLLVLPAAAAEGDDQQAAREAILKDREETQAWLRSSPSSYLAAIARKDFGKKTTLAVGSAKDNDVRLDDPAVKPHHARVSVEGGRFRVQAADAGALFSVGKASAPLVREAEVESGAIRVAPFTLRLSHQGFPAVIVFDPKSPRFAEYKGIEYFPIDLSYRFRLRLVPDQEGARLPIQSTHSPDRAATRVGWFEFTLAGKPCRLAATRLLEPGVSPESLSILFRDATTGKETYKVGRYLSPKKRDDGSYVVDFNMAYNPACAFSKFYNCPIPPKENTLSAAVRAGERDSRYH